MRIIMHKIITKRLILRPPKMNDAQNLVNGLGDYEIAKFLLVPHPYNLVMAKDWLKQKIANKNIINESYFMIELKNNEFVGGIGFSEKSGKPTLSYWLMKQYWNNAYGFEAAQSIIEYFFANSKINKIFSGALHFNIASLKIQQKLGFVKLGTTSLFCPAQNKYVENIDTMLTRAIYEKVKNEIS